MKNLADAFKEIREAFMRENLNVPEILLDSYDDGVRFSSALQSLAGRLIPVERTVIDGEQFMECIVNGLTVRWPIPHPRPPIEAAFDMEEVK